MSIFTCSFETKHFVSVFFLTASSLFIRCLCVVCLSCLVSAFDSLQNQRYILGNIPCVCYVLLVFVSLIGRLTSKPIKQNQVRDLKDKTLKDTYTSSTHSQFFCTKRNTLQTDLEFRLTFFCLFSHILQTILTQNLAAHCLFFFTPNSLLQFLLFWHKNTS